MIPGKPTGIYNSVMNLSKGSTKVQFETKFSQAQLKQHQQQQQLQAQARAQVMSSLELQIPFWLSFVSGNGFVGLGPGG